jgi:hypothetical protein
MDTRPSRSGAVHPSCVRLEDNDPPVQSLDRDVRAAPKYGGPPLRRYGCSIVLVLGLATLIVALLKLR